MSSGVHPSGVIQIATTILTVSAVFILLLAVAPFISPIMNRTRRFIVTSGMTMFSFGAGLGALRGGEYMAALTYIVCAVILVFVTKPHLHHRDTPPPALPPKKK